LPAAGATLFAAPLTAEPTPDTVLLTALVACCTVLPGAPPGLVPPPLEEPVADPPPPVADELVVLEDDGLALPAPPPPAAVAPGVPLEAPPDVAGPPAAVRTLSRCLTGELAAVGCCLRTTEAGDG
jgi:hypothetical protein